MVLVSETPPDARDGCLNSEPVVSWPLMGNSSAWSTIRHALGKIVGAAILFAFLAGWLTAAAATYELVQVQAAKTWPSRKGVLTHSYVRYIRTPPRPYWKAEIAGTYLDDGTRFGVSRVRFGIGNTGLGRRGVEAIVAKYPVNTVVDVYYSPTDPKRRTLEPLVSATSTWVALWVGLGFGLLPFVLYVYGRITGYHPPTTFAALRSPLFPSS